MTTYTVKFNLALPADGDGSDNGSPWGAAIRNNFVTIDTALDQISCSSFHLARTAGIDAAKVDGSLSGTDLFGHAYEDNTSFSSATTGAYASYDSLVTMTGATAYNHLYSYESRFTYAGTGGLTTMASFMASPTVSGPVTALRCFTCSEALGVGTIAEQSGLYVPSLARGTNNYGVNLGVMAGANNYNVYAVGTAKNLMNGLLTLNGGLTMGGGIITLPSVGQTFHFATDTNLVFSGTGTLGTIASMNDALNAYEPLMLNASVIVPNCAIRRKVYTVATLPGTNAGGDCMVSDSSVVAAGNFGAVVVGGGTNTVPVYADGASWRIG